MPKEGDVSVGAVAVDVELDTTKAEQEAATLSGKIVDTGNKAGQQASSGFKSWGSNASNSIRDISGNLRALNATFGETGPLSQFTGLLSTTSMGFQHIADAEEQAEASGKSFIGLGPGLTGLGLIIAGLAGGMSAIAAPLQHSQAELTTAITNTGNSMQDFQGKVDQAAQTGAKFGFTTSDVQRALAELTVETKNPNEALRELNMTETVAAARHTDLSHAARYMGQAHAGMFRVFRQFGIEIQSVKNPEKELESAHKALGTATDELQKKEQSLADFEARVTDERTKKTEEWQTKVNDAQSKVTEATDRFTELQQQYSTQDQQARENAAQAAEDAAQRKIDADNRVADLEATLAGTSAKAQDAKDAMAEAEMRVNTARVRVAETSGVAQQSAIEQLSQAEFSYQKLKRDQASQQLTDQRDLQKAQVDQNKAVYDGTKAQNDKVKADQEALKHQEDLKKASDEVTKAQQTYTNAQAQLAAAQTLTLAQQQEERRLTDAVTEGKQKLSDANAKVAQAQADQADAQRKFHELEQQFMDREHGLLDRRANTWVGHIASIKASITDLLQHVASSAAPLMTGIGGAVMGVGGAISIGRGVRGMARRMRGGGAAEETLAEGTKAVEGAASEGAEEGGALAPIVKGGKVAEEQLALNLKGITSKTAEMSTGVEGEAEKTAGSLGRLRGVGSSIASGFSSMAGGVKAAMTGMVGFVTSPVGLIILSIGALILIGVEVAKHWGAITRDVSAAWRWLEREAREVFNGIIHFLDHDVLGFLKVWVPRVALMFIPGGPLLVALNMFGVSWSDMWNGVLNVGKEIWNLILGGAETMIDGILTGISTLLTGLGHLPGPFGAPFREAAKHVEDFRSGVNSTLDGLKADITKKATDAGTALGQGLATGITATTTAAQAAAQGLTTATIHQMRQAGEIQSPSRLVAREVGHPLGQGIALGLTQSTSHVHEAAKSLMQGTASAMGNVSITPGLSRTERQAPVAGVGDRERRGTSDRERLGDRPLHYEPHFHQEIEPAHVLHDLVWNAPGVMVP